MISSYEDKLMTICRFNSIKVAKLLQSCGYSLADYHLAYDIFDAGYFFNALEIIFGADYKILASYDDDMSDEHVAQIVIDDQELLNLSKLLAWHPMRDHVFDELKICLYRLEHIWNDSIGFREYPAFEEVDLVLGGRARYSSIYFKYVNPYQQIDYSEEVAVFLAYKRKLKSFIAQYEAELQAERAVA